MIDWEFVGSIVSWFPTALVTYLIVFGLVGLTALAIGLIIYITTLTFKWLTGRRN